MLGSETHVSDKIDNNPIQRVLLELWKSNTFSFPECYLHKNLSLELPVIITATYKKNLAQK